MSWRGQGGKRAKGRRGDQDPELDNTAWLAELEREAAAQTDDEEEDWASTLRGRRPAAPPPQPPPDPSRAPARDQGAEPGDSGPGYGTDPGLAEAPPAPDPDWSWRSPDVDAFGEPAASTQADPGPGWERYEGVPRSHPAPEAFGGAPQDAGTADWAGSQTTNGGWADPGDQSANASGTDLGDQDDHGPWAAPGERAERESWVGTDDGTGAGGGADLYGLGEPPAGDGAAGNEDQGGWRSAGVDTPTGVWDSAEPVGREPDYPALFGELYRRSAAQQDPIWEAPPAVEPMPEQGQPDPPAATWPFEETTQSWEPSDRSFIWPPDELPSTPAEWDQPGSTDWLDDPAPRAVPPEPDQTAAWPAAEPGARAWEEPAPAPESRDSPWAGQPGAGNGVVPPPAGLTTPAPPPPAGSVGPPPDDWAAAISTDGPAARRAADPSATGVWPPDEAADAEPGVPLGPGSRPHAAGPQAPPGERPGGRATRSRGPGSGAAPATELPGPAGSGLAGPPGGAQGAPGARSGRPAAGGTRARAGTGAAGGAAGRERRPPRDPRGGATDLAGGQAARTSSRPGRAPADAAGDREALPVDTGKGRRNRPAGERQARAWPRVVAVISWIVLVMVLCWYYVFPWLERVLPENF